MNKLEDLSLAEALSALKEESRESFHMPGHKYGGLGLRENFPSIWDIDTTEIPGSDNLHDPEDVLLYAKQRASRAYGSKESFFLVNGSSCGIMAMIMGSVKRGEKVLICRDAHRSVHQAVSLGGLHPVYVMPEVDKESGIAIGLSPRGLQQALEAHPDIKAVVCTYPSYSGACTPIGELRDITRAHGVLLLVDEAHGAHLWLSKFLPPSALSFGADLVVQSLHKTMPALTQTAILHLGTDRASREGITHYLKIFQSSSPSYILLTSIDWAINIGLEKGPQAMETLLSQIGQFKERMGLLGFVFYDRKTINGAWHFDETKLCLSGKAFGLDGYELEKRLRAKGIQVEYALESHVLLMTSIATEHEHLHRLERVLTEISQEIAVGEGKVVALETGVLDEDSEGSSNEADGYLVSEMAVLPEDLDRYESCWELVEESLGKVSADWVIPYPPGVPMLCPGEVISEQALKQLLYYQSKGHKLFGVKENRLRILTL